MKLPVLLAVGTAIFAAQAGCGSHGDTGQANRIAGPPTTQNDPGSLVVTAPARGVYVPISAGPQITVAGNGANGAVTLNGKPAKVNPDGTFQGSVQCTVGLNLVHVADGSSSVDVPFLFGDIRLPSAPVAQAVAVRISASGLDSSNTSNLSVAGLAETALESYDLLGALNGQKFSGSDAGADWTFSVTGTHYGAVVVHAKPANGGVAISGSVAKIEVDGNLSVKVLGIGPTSSVKLTADSADLGGTINLNFDSDSSSIKASMPDPTVTLQNFEYQSGNDGLPCCLDSIMTDILKPKVNAAVKTVVQDHLPSELSVALSSFGLPSMLDFSSAGLPATVSLADAFDTATFDADGETITARLLMSHPFAASDPGAKAPGWIAFAQPVTDLSTNTPFAVSLSLDSINQMLFSVWGQGALTRSLSNLPVVGTLKLAASMPPILTAQPNNHLQLAIGEVIANGTVDDIPVTAGLTLFVDVTPSIDPSTSTLSFAPGSTPTVSITWLSAPGLPESAKGLVAGTAPTLIAAALKPIAVPLPSVSLDALVPGDTAVLAAGAVVTVDTTTSRLVLAGDYTLSQ